MERLERILAAVDLGPDGDAITRGSAKAVERAVWIAKRVGASLVLVHSEKPDEYWDAQRDAFVDGHGQRAERKRELARVLDGVREQGVDARVVLRAESAWLAIVHEVLRSNVDLVVAGKRTDVESDDRKLGTVAHKLLRQCPCSVWLEDPRDDHDPRVILAATDLSTVGDRAVRLAAWVADAFAAELHVVHAFSFTMEIQLEGGDARRAWEHDRRADAIRRIERVLSDTPLAGAATLHVGLTSPAQAILEGVRALDPGLVVMGTVSRGGIPGLLMGNTAERMFDRIDCALLTVKPDDFVSPLPPDPGEDAVFEAGDARA